MAVANSTQVVSEPPAVLTDWVRIEIGTPDRRIAQSLIDALKQDFCIREFPEGLLLDVSEMDGTSRNSFAFYIQRS